MKKFFSCLALYCFTLVFVLFISCFLTGCSQLRRAERDIIGNIPGVERIDWMIKGETVGNANIECTGTGGTLIDALEDIGCKSIAPE